MSPSSSHALPPELHVLLRRGQHESLPHLRPQKPYSPDLRPAISSLDAPIPVRGILHLLNDDIDAAHTLVQDDDSNRDSNLLHSILHRREGDFWNSKWWLNQFSHPFLGQLYAEKKLDGKVGAKQFVDMVERVTSKGATTACAAQRDVKEAKEWQWKEHKALAEYLFSEYRVATT
ncbi:hypothetical protein PSEUBRA_006127 [Kalmanozyma brasiliensis GHG001]|uniref:Uncharacterized protein n=1 Tax=Kalmanozyma brasiliensis (strain GHG001) TaxID=1365824 RepID=V5GFL5_KALBG|nr:uncharacterized protein PSEUBRA_006127 [Kalmanozyma brasiliensis GHG001]EST04822.1 hypothetical protein PSEUBRA_006127 [Kalmanozyma brasiliensis GHG001]